jgi:hypothetical protein
MPRRASASAILGVLLVLYVGNAVADPARDQSRAAFMRGVADAHQGHYTAARDAFLEAYTLFAHPSILMNLGIARWHTGEYVQAERDLARFLSDDGGASDEEIANARSGLAAVRQHLGTVRVRIAPDRARATLDDQPVALAPGAFAEVRAIIGSSELRVEADGYEATHQTLLVSHDNPTTVDLTLKPATTDSTHSGGHSGGGPPPPEDKTRKLVAYGALGVGAASAVVWAACGVRAVMLANEYNTPGSANYQSPGAKASGITFRTTADVLFVTALVSGSVGAYLLLFPGKTDKSTTTSLVLGPASFRLEGTF